MGFIKAQGISFYIDLINTQLPDNVNEHPTVRRGLLPSPTSPSKLLLRTGSGGPLPLMTEPHLAAGAAVLSEAVSAPWLAISRDRGR
jgi:hypothetical protein